MAADTLDPIPHASQDAPHALYRTLQRDAPVHYVPERDLWVLSRHADVLAALKDLNIKKDRLQNNNACFFITRMFITLCACQKGLGRASRHRHILIRRQ